jgi:PAS domain S-box-containing protein
VIRLSLPGLRLGAAVAAALLVVNIALSFHDTRQLNEDAHWVAHTQEVVIHLESVLSLLKDAETGQRGFLLTGEQEYLEPFRVASARMDDALDRREVDALQRLTADNRRQQSRFPELRRRIAAKIEELERTVAVRKAAGFEVAREALATGRDKAEMDAVRAGIGDMVRHERLLLARRIARTDRTYRAALLSGLFSGLSALIALGVLSLLLRRYLAVRARAAAVIAEQGERLRTTLASIGDAVIATDTEGRVTNMNAVAEELTGWTTDEATGHLLDAVFHIVNETSRQPVANPVKKALAHGLIVGLANHTLLISKDGTERPIDDSAAPIRCREGETVGCVLVFRDVSERRKAEILLQESESRFRQLTDTMPQMVWVAGPDGSSEYLNRRWLEYAGGAPEESLGQGWSGFLHPDDRQRSLDRWSLAMRTGEPFETEYRFRSQAGSYRWFLGRALPVRDEAGKIVAWFGTSTDIEDFKRVQEERQKFVSLIENSTDFIGIFDADGSSVYGNRAAMDLVGLEGIDEVRRTPVRELFFPEDQPRVVEEFFPSVLARGRGEMDVRFRHFKTGEARWMSYKVFVLKDTGGRPAGLGTVSQDITERRRLEYDLRKLAADLSETDRRKNEFLAMLAHELRNPLAPIRNSLQIVRLTRGDGEAAQAASEVMERQIGQMVRLVDDLLDVSRISRGTIDLRRERVELTAILRQAVETSRPAIESARHELVMTQAPQPVYLHADPIRLAQAFSNLLSNASKYSEPGGRISVHVGRQGGDVLVSVKDTGVGIPAHMLHNIFEMFTQVDKSLERSQIGLGIGLTLVQRLVEMHGGAVQAFSDGPGQGSEFVVRLPVMDEAAQPSPVETLGDPASTGPRRILVVDDNHDSAMSLATLLRITGHQTTTAADGLEAVEVAAAFRPDVVLLDLGLPKLNGYEAARQMRRQPWGASMVLVALTGWGQEDDRRKSRDAGFDGHMVKPVEFDALMKLLSSLLSEQSAPA